MIDLHTYSFMYVIKYFFLLKRGWVAVSLFTLPVALAMAGKYEIILNKYINK